MQYPDLLPSTPHAKTVTLVPRPLGSPFATDSPLPALFLDPEGHLLELGPVPTQAARSTARARDAKPSAQLAVRDSARLAGAPQAASGPLSVAWASHPGEKPLWADRVPAAGSQVL